MPKVVYTIHIGAPGARTTIQGVYASQAALHLALTKLADAGVTVIKTESHILQTKTFIKEMTL